MTAPLTPAELPLAPGALDTARELSLGRDSGPSDTASGVLARVADTAARTPERTAVTDGGSTLTYAGLLARVGRFRAVLSAAGCTAGTVVAAVGDRSADTVAAFLALESLGAVYLPIAPDWPAQRVGEVLARSGAGLLLDYSGSPGGGGPRGRTAVAAAAGLGTATVSAPGGDTPVSVAFADENPDRSLEPRYCIFTSGTTGRPKGASVEHRGMMNHLWAKVEDLGLTGADRLAFTAPLVFDISVWQMLAPLLVGGAVVVVREPELAFPRRLTNVLEQSGVTVVELVPTVVGWITEQAERRTGTTLPALRWLISTGEELHTGLAARFLAAAPHVRLLNAYGPTECSDDITHHEVTAPDTARPRLPVGAPVGGARLYLLAREDDGRWRAAGAGESGELFVGGVVVGLGYLNDPDNNAAAFFTDPFDAGSPTRRLYRTGDLARFEDGVVHYLGRVDRQVKVAGVRMELDEIEVVLRRHPAVDECAVVVPVVDGRPELAAYYTLSASVPAEELKACLAAALPEAMVPRRLTELDALPLTQNGKTDHRALRQLTQDGSTPAKV
ncbi:amino acid adenylation domain-containing protein [Streptomyces hokutonensis]|uniref:amino acid adenylation domain-containing protein n=1 Tax=Streptomyces hokutonensis TaxID=1306990 RepID=UPI00036E008F|nr:amino acid adenylation domain-containing protein [Streptomyces hokutonensis]